ncbi:zinc-binding dehydrogenase [Euzebya pacifica]
MRAAVLTEHGGPDAIEVRDVVVPQPRTGEVLVRVAAAAINNTDLWSREGAYGSAEDADAVAGWRGVPLDFPRIQGGDAVGRIVAIGPGGDRGSVGQRVLIDPAWFDDAGELQAFLGSERDGAFAEYVVVDASHAHDVSDSPLSDAQLACLPTAYGTAMGMLERAGVAAGQVLLVTGASGGVGTALVQLGAARGAEVVAVTSAGHADAVRTAGAHHLVLRGEGDLGDAVREVLEGRGVDVVADVVGGPAFGQVLGTLSPGGSLVIAGAIAGPNVQLDLRQLYLPNRRIIGSTLHTPEQFAALVQAARDASVLPSVAEEYPLAEIHAAQARFARGDFEGKLVIVP